MWSFKWCLSLQIGWQTEYTGEVDDFRLSAEGRKAHFELFIHSSFEGWYLNILPSTQLVWMILFAASWRQYFVKRQNQEVYYYFFLTFYSFSPLAESRITAQCPLTFLGLASLLRACLSYLSLCLYYHGHPGFFLPNSMWYFQLRLGHWPLEGSTARRLYKEVY